MTEASMTRTRMTEARETTRTSPPAPQTAPQAAAARPAAFSGILVIAQIHRVSEDM
ncbi:hypothetical protein [Microbispora bryophytorum]|uniref:Uncharacterized protein n=2 Tax=Microbispora bryophytorum TaxID=1460882 RepID=A0A8H9GWU7_9ACTN|nr:MULTISPECIES: hypothetical protein [Microbispora]MBD3135566.1 hypothetical protein [Microbispora bryophytorum]MBD3143212.1 hypothetical protein [Microbispora camponoti]GGN98306.1 hypothetical protein GCM10011574_02780 [Microbispora bryophytorum]